MRTAFGVSGQELAVMDAGDPQTPPRTFATSDAVAYGPTEGAGSLLDPHGSALFWVAAAAVLGLILVTGQVRVEAALGMRGGKK
jgi:hypothetical protein